MIRANENPLLKQALSYDEHGSCTLKDRPAKCTISKNKERDNNVDSGRKFGAKPISTYRVISDRQGQS